MTVKNEHFDSGTDDNGDAIEMDFTVKEGVLYIHPLDSVKYRDRYVYCFPPGMWSNVLRGKYFVSADIKELE